MRTRLLCALALLLAQGCRPALHLDAYSETYADGGTHQGAPVGLRIDGLPPGPVTLDQGATARLRLLFVFADGSESDAGGAAQAASSAPAVASIDAQLVLHALSPGDAIVSAAAARAGGAPLQAQVVLHVQDPAGGVTVAVEVTPSRAALAPGLGLQLLANATRADHRQVSATALAIWSSSSPAVCTVDDGARKGFVTAVHEGSCTVSASYQGLAGTASIAVSALAVIRLSISPAAPVVARGSTVQLLATAVLADGSAYDATGTAAWSSVDAAVAAVDATGQVSGNASGSTVITAKLLGLVAQVRLRVDAAALLSISVSPPNLLLPLGLLQALRATAIYADGTTADVSAGVAWASDSPSAVSVDPDGVVRALVKGRARISAALAGKQGVALVDATDAALTALFFIPATLALPVGSSGRLRLVGTFSDHTLKDVSVDAAWSTQDQAVATVDATGLVSGLAQGSTQVSARLSGQTATATALVTEAALAALVVAPVSVVLPAGATQRLMATGVYSDGTLRDATESATWDSDAAAVAAVSNAAGTRGLVTGASAGKASVTAALGGVTSNASAVTVLAASLLGLRLAPDRLGLPQYLTLPVRLLARYSDGSEFDETAAAAFASDQPLTASVVASGPGAGLVTGVQPGQATVTGFLGALSATCAVRVVDAPPQSIQVVALRDTMKVGDAQQLRALVTFAGRPRPVDATQLCSWTSSDPRVASLDPRQPGLLVAAAPGTVQATAALSGVSGSHVITVSPLALARIDVLESAFVLPAGLNRTLIAKATYSDGSTADVTFGAAWSSDRPQVALVADTNESKGLVTAVAPGVAHLRAQVAGISGSAQATVDQAHPTSLTISPANPVVTSQGGPFRPQTVRFSATAHFDDGNDYDVTRSAAWFSSDPAVVAISNSAAAKGVADVLAIGGATVTAAYGSLKATTFLTSR